MNFIRDGYVRRGGEKSQNATSVKWGGALQTSFPKMFPFMPERPTSSRWVFQLRIFFFYKLCHLKTNCASCSDQNSPPNKKLNWQFACHFPSDSKVVSMPNTTHASAIIFLGFSREWRTRNFSLCFLVLFACVRLESPHSTLQEMSWSLSLGWGFCSHVRLSTLCHFGCSTNKFWQTHFVGSRNPWSTTILCLSLKHKVCLLSCAASFLVSISACWAICWQSQHVFLWPMHDLKRCTNADCIHAVGFIFW